MNISLTHRPHGIEHPYATSADQRIPTHPSVGEDFTVGVVSDPTEFHGEVICEVEDGTGAVIEYQLQPVSVNAVDAAALAGGDGHLASAQAAQLESAGSWAVELPGLGAEQSARYRFFVRTENGV